MISPAVATPLLAFLRIATFVSLLPPFAGRGLPKTVKVGLAYALAMGMTTGHALNAPVPDGPMLVWLGLRETLTGGLLAICLGLFLYPAKIAGEYLNQEVGLSFATNISAMEPQSQGVLSQVLEAFAVLLFMALNVDHYLYRFLQLSFERRPVGGPVWQPNAEAIAQLGDLLSAWGLQIVAPLACVMALTSLGLFLASRWTPQFNLQSIGFQLRVLVGLTAMFFGLPELISMLQLSLYEVADWTQHL
jgi:flagellar biosynthetic protein FliR